LEAAFADGAATLAILRGGERLSIHVAADPGCSSRFQVLPSPRIEAHADGRYVQVSSAMIEFTRDDDELAATVAHELAHNILRHRARLNAARVDRGLLAPFGRNGRLFRQTELEADRLAIHLMARAGFDPAAAVRLWTRQSRASSRLFAGTHPDWRARIAALEGEIAAIAAARARGAEAVVPLPLGPLGPERR
jgi:predicted Zn-dependent protease